MKNQFTTTKRLPTNFKAPAKQQNGMALIITIIVLLVLTVVGLASTDSNRIQAALTRNSQFRLEAFNTSYTEIDAQLDTINTTASIDAGIPPSIRTIIEQESGSVNSVDDAGIVKVLAQHPEMTQRVENAFTGKCLVIGSSIDVGNKVRDCHMLRMDSDAAYKDTAISSEQTQNFRYESFNAL